VANQSHTPSLSKGATRTYHMVKSFDTSNPLELEFGAPPGNHNNPSTQAHRRWPWTITNTCQTSTAAPSRLGGGNHQEKQESHSKWTPKCQLDANSQANTLWSLNLTSNMQRSKRDEWEGSCLAQSAHKYVKEYEREREPWASQWVFIDVPLLIELLGTRFSSSRANRTR
jgi:hypothetical protein